MLYHAQGNYYYVEQTVVFLCLAVRYAFLADNVYPYLLVPKQSQM